MSVLNVLEKVATFSGRGGGERYFFNPFGAKVWDPSMFNPVAK